MLHESRKYASVVIYARTVLGGRIYNCSSFYDFNQIAKNVSLRWLLQPGIYFDLCRRKEDYSDELVFSNITNNVRTDFPTGDITHLYVSRLRDKDGNDCFGKYSSEIAIAVISDWRDK